MKKASNLFWSFVLWFCVGLYIFSTFLIIIIGFTIEAGIGFYKEVKRCLKSL